jgi:glycosyltransferase involved in cell wall biosynthesis
VPIIKIKISSLPTHRKTFAQSVVNLLKQPELRQKIGAAAMKLVKAEHDWESIVAKLERIYLEIVSSTIELRSIEQENF